MLNLSCGRQGEFMKSGDFMLVYSETPNMSEFNSEYAAMERARKPSPPPEGEVSFFFLFYWRILRLLFIVALWKHRKLTTLHWFLVITLRTWIYYGKAAVVAIKSDKVVAIDRFLSAVGAIRLLFIILEAYIAYVLYAVACGRRPIYKLTLCFQN